jgi:hypothetical protein
MGWAGHVSCMGEVRNSYNILVRKPEGKICTNSWDDNIKIELKSTGGQNVDWIHLVQNITSNH